MARNQYDGSKFDKDLLCCPFCGDHAEGRPRLAFENKDRHFRPYYYVSCGDCGAMPNNYSETEKEAIDFWNRRPIYRDDELFKIGFQQGKLRIIDLIYSLDMKGNIQKGDV